jgi:hypothetical protein
MARKKIKLGDRVRDEITGFTGIAIGITEFQHGCTRVGVKSQELHEGKPINAEWFDEPQLKVIKKEVVKRGSRRTGGPMPSTPQKRKDPS